MDGNNRYASSISIKKLSALLFIVNIQVINEYVLGSKITKRNSV